MANETGSNKTMIIALVVVLAIIAIIFMMNQNRDADTTIGNAMDGTGARIEAGADRAGNAMERGADRAGNAIDNATDGR